MLQWITYFSAWFQVSITLFIMIGGFVAYRQPQFHNTRTIVALITLVFLALTELFLVLAQAHSIIPTRPLSSILLTAIYGCCVFVGASEFLFIPSCEPSYNFVFTSIAHIEGSKLYVRPQLGIRRLRGRGWNISRVCVAIFYLAFTIIVAIGYVYNL